MVWLFVVPFIEITIPDMPQLAAALVSGFSIMFLFVTPYTYVISKEEISSIVPILGFSSLFVLILSTIFLGEFLTIVNYAGFALLFLAGLVITVEKVKSSLRVNKTLLIALGGAAGIAVSMILMKFFYLTENFWNGFFWFNVGGFLGTLVILFLPGNLLHLKNNARLLSRKVVALFLLTAGFVFLADLSILYAIKLGPVSLVYVIGSTQMAFVFIIALLLSRYFPSILKERTDRKTLLKKSVAIAIMIVGLVLLNN